MNINNIPGDLHDILAQKHHSCFYSAAFYSKTRVYTGSLQIGRNSP